MLLPRLAVMLCPTFAYAETPLVMTDIAPIHSLTAMVMNGVGAPQLLLPPNADPHDFAMRPSDAAALNDANVVIWVGPSLTPWLQDPLATLGADATQLTLLTAGITPLSLEHDDHDHGHADGIDPHAWLSPAVSAIWVHEIADALAVTDPDNAQIYMTNAANASASLTALSAEISLQFTEAKPAPYILPHAAFQYFETQFDIHAAGTISDSDAADPGPAHIANLKAQMPDIACVLHDPLNDRWAQLLVEGTNAKTAPLDLIGSTLAQGPDLYPALIRQIAQTLTDCAS